MTSLEIQARDVIARLVRGEMLGNSELPQPRRIWARALEGLGVRTHVERVRAIEPMPQEEVTTPGDEGGGAPAPHQSPPRELSVTFGAGAPSSKPEVEQW